MVELRLVYVDAQLKLRAYAYWDDGQGAALRPAGETDVTGCSADVTIDSFGIGGLNPTEAHPLIVRSAADTPESDGSSSPHRPQRGRYEGLRHDHDPGQWYR